MNSRRSDLPRRRRVELVNGHILYVDGGITAGFMNRSPNSIAPATSRNIHIGGLYHER